MATRGRAYGLSLEIQTKIDSKYDTELEDTLTKWIIAQCGPDVGMPEPGKMEFQKWLKNGCVSVAFCVRVNMLPFTLCWYVQCDPSLLGAVSPHQQPVPNQANQDRQGLRHGIQADGTNLPVPQSC